MIISPLFKEDKPHFHTNGGSLAVGYSLGIYRAGTDILADVYADQEGENVYENPIILNSRGEPSGQGIYVDNSVYYKIILKDRIGSVIWSMDYISALQNGEGSFIQVNSDWNATEGVAEILNKPHIPKIENIIIDN